MQQSNTVFLSAYCPLKAENAGLFISRGGAMHPTRIIQSYELTFVKQGEIDMCEDDQVFHLEAGHTLQLWPNRQHGGTKPMSLGLKFYWIHFDLENRAEDNEHSGLEEPAPLVKVPQVNLISQPEKLERLFRMFLDDQETGHLSPHTANILTMLMLIEVAQPSEEKPSSSQDLNVVATWAHTYIRLNYDRPITAAKIAGAVGSNPDYLGRIYHKAYGCTLTEAIHRRRIRVACQYLLDSQITIEQVAQKCGFNDPDYFRRIFQRHMQISPGNYRNEYSRVHINTH